jgi:murein DD-endopeptidase MepM/ murein hydrolase activator NlpD
MAFCLTLLVAPGGVAPVDASNLSDRISAARTRQAELQRAIDRQKQLLDQLRSDEDTARSALASSKKQLDGIDADQSVISQKIAEATAALARSQSKRDSLAGELRRLDWTLSLLEQEIAAGSDELDARRRLLGARLAEAYRTQNTSLLEQLFGAGSFTDVLSDASAYLAFGDQDALLAQDISADQAALDSLRALTAATRYRTDQLRRDEQSAATELVAQQAELKDAKAQSAELGAKISAIKADQLAAAKRILASQHKSKAALARQAAVNRKANKRLERLIAIAHRKAEARRRAQQSGGGGGHIPEGNGRFQWPTTGTISQEYGCTGFPLERPRGSCAHFHRGIDIFNTYGTPIRAAGGGVVAFVGWNPFDSYDPSFVVIIAHGGGLTTYYGHLQSRYVVHSGQSVRAGQLIGYMGMTGNTTGSHLHWEVRVRGHDVNPRAYI